MMIIFFIVFTVCNPETGQCKEMIGINHPFAEEKECKKIAARSRIEVKGDPRFSNIRCVGFGPLTKV
jgi:hypothetical protein